MPGVTEEELGSILDWTISISHGPRRPAPIASLRGAGGGLRLSPEQVDALLDEIEELRARAAEGGEIGGPDSCFAKEAERLDAEGRRAVLAFPAPPRREAALLEPGPAPVGYDEEAGEEPADD